MLKDCQQKAIPTLPSADQTLCPSFLTGFSQADGCFQILLIKENKAKHGFRAQPAFSLTQWGTPHSTLLKTIRKGWNSGNFNTSEGDGCATLSLRGIRVAQKVVIPHFQRCNLLPEKLWDFLKYQSVVELMATKQHLSKEGWRKVVHIAYTMNHAGRRKRAREEVLGCAQGATTTPPSPECVQGRVVSTPLQSKCFTGQGSGKGVRGPSLSHLSSYISGVVQGDGGFSITLTKAGGVKAVFSLGMSNDSLEVLRLAQRILDCGTIYSITPTYSRLMVTDLESLREKVVPHFREYPLWDDKATHFHIFSCVVTHLMVGMRTLTPSQRQERRRVIVELVWGSNMAGKRRRRSKAELLDNLKDEPKEEAKEEPKEEPKEEAKEEAKDKFKEEAKVGGSEKVSSRDSTNWGEN